MRLFRSASATSQVACVVMTGMLSFGPGCRHPQTSSPASSLPAQWQRLIVTFRIEPLPAEAPGEEQIARARQSVLGDLPTGSYRVVRVFQSIPAIAIDASALARRVLEKSPKVTAIEEDTLSAPQ